MKAAIAQLLSLVLPGTGHLLYDLRQRGWVSLVLAGGALFSIILYSSLLAKLALALVYLLVGVHAMLDLRSQIHGTSAPVDLADQRVVIAALVLIGPFAVPLLWQSPRFSTRQKWLLTVAVLVIAVAAILLTGTLGTILEEKLRQLR